jgi:hypothetical protein
VFHVILIIHSAIIYLGGILQLDFVREMHCTFCKLRTELLNVIYMNFRFQMVKYPKDQSLIGELHVAV